MADGLKNGFDGKIGKHRAEMYPEIVCIMSILTHF